METEVTVFSVKDALPGDFENPIDESRLVRCERQVISNGKEALQELFDDEGKLFMRTVTVYDDRGLVLEIREYHDDPEVPYKHLINTYNDAGKLLLEQSYFDGELGKQLSYDYDDQGRLTQKTEKEEDMTQYIQYDYDAGLKSCVKETHWADDVSWQEIKNKYAVVNGEEKLIEQHVENKINAFDSRVYRFYTYGSIANGVVRETYNEDGDFLEECREKRDSRGNALMETWHTDDAEESVSYKGTIFEYNKDNECVSTQQIEKGVVIHVHKIKLDKQKRKLIEYYETNGASTVMVYRYNTISE